MQNALVCADKAIIDLAALHRHRLLWSKVVKERARYRKLYEQVLQVVNAYYEEEEGLTKLVKNLRYEIRIQTRGTPATIAQDSISAAGFIPNGTEQLYNAQQHLLKSAYRLLAPMVHPDRGGSTELFQEVVTAYRLKDMTFLQELYLMLTKDSLFWRSSEEAAAYCKQELERPAMSIQMLQQTYEFQITRKHVLGRPREARALAKERLAALIVELQRELSHMRNPEAFAALAEYVTEEN
jgi:hypothetical protein